MRFYTNAFVHKGKVYCRGVENGKHYSDVIPYKPYLFVASKKADGPYKTIFGEPVSRMDFDSIHEARDFTKRYKDVDGFSIYGMTKFVYPFLYDYYPGEVQYNPDEINVLSIDIETKLGTVDFATAIETAPNEITAITLVKNNKDIYSFGCKPWPDAPDNVTYTQCKDERELLLRFISRWKQIDPDVITGWNVEFFDVPYICNRIRRILDEDKLAELSPWGLINPYEIEIKGRKVTSYEFKGITVLDYMQLDKKFSYKNRTSYKLDAVAEEELGENKVDYSEYGNLDDLYEKNFPLYMTYNVMDTVLVSRLEEKMKFIELVYAMAYDAKINFADAFTTVTMWDVIIHNYLMDQKIVVSPQKESYNADIAGGFVKDTVPGMHEWVVTFDLTSLYPHLIMQYNISPETFVDRINIPSIDQLLNGATIDHGGYSVTANGCRYRKDIRGFMPELMDWKFDRRTKFKDLMKKAKEKNELIEAEIKKRGLK